jgi:hypothetical protein
LDIIGTSLAVDPDQRVSGSVTTVSRVQLHSTCAVPASPAAFSVELVTVLVQDIED